jgi:hypothetical protein
MSDIAEAIREDELVEDAILGDASPQPVEDSTPSRSQEAILIPVTPIILKTKSKIENFVKHKPGWRDETVVFELDQKFRLPAFTTRTFPSTLTNKVFEIFELVEGTYIREDKPVQDDMRGVSLAPGDLFVRPYRSFEGTNHVDTAVIQYRFRGLAEFRSKREEINQHLFLRRAGYEYDVRGYAIDLLMMKIGRDVRLRKFHVVPEVVETYLQEAVPPDMYLDIEGDFASEPEIMLWDFNFEYYERLMQTSPRVRDYVTGMIEGNIRRKLSLSAFARATKFTEFARLLNVRTNILEAKNKVPGELVSGNAKVVMEKLLLIGSMNRIYQGRFDIPSIERLDISTLSACFSLCNRVPYSYLTVRSWRVIHNYIFNQFVLNILVNEHREQIVANRQNQRGQRQAPPQDLFLPITEAEKYGKSKLLVAIGYLKNGLLKDKCMLYFESVGTGKLYRPATVFLSDLRDDRAVDVVRSESSRYCVTSTGQYSSAFPDDRQKLHAGQFRTVRITGDRGYEDVAMRKFIDFKNLVSALKRRRTDLSADHFTSRRDAEVMPTLLHEMARMTDQYRSYNANFNRVIDGVCHHTLTLPITDVEPSMGRQIDISRNEALALEWVANYEDMFWDTTDLSDAAAGWNVVYSLNEVGRHLLAYYHIFVNYGMAEVPSQVHAESTSAYNTSYFQRSQILAQAFQSIQGNSLTKIFAKMMQEEGQWDSYMAFDPEDTYLAQLRQIAAFIIDNRQLFGWTVDVIIRPAATLMDSRSDQDGGPVRNFDDPNNRYIWSNVGDARVHPVRAEPDEDGSLVYGYDDVNRKIRLRDKRDLVAPGVYHVRHMNLTEGENQMSREALVKLFESRGQVTLGVSRIDRRDHNEEFMRIRDAPIYAPLLWPFIETDEIQDLYPGLVGEDGDDLAIFGDPAARLSFGTLPITEETRLVIGTPIKMRPLPELKSYV